MTDSISDPIAHDNGIDKESNSARAPWDRSKGHSDEFAISCLALISALSVLKRLGSSIIDVATHA